MANPLALYDAKAEIKSITDALIKAVNKGARLAHDHANEEQTRKAIDDILDCVQKTISELNKHYTARSASDVQMVIKTVTRKHRLNLPQRERLDRLKTKMSNIAQCHDNRVVLRQGRIS